MTRQPRSYVVAAAVREALCRFDRRTEEICSHHQLTANQYTLLLLIRGATDESEKTTVGELARRLRLTHHSVTERLQRAESLGLITRHRASHDQRIVEISLTPEAKHRLNETYHALGEESDILISFLASVNQRRSLPS